MRVPEATGKEKSGVGDLATGCLHHVVRDSLRVPRSWLWVTERSTALATLNNSSENSAARATFSATRDDPLSKFALIGVPCTRVLVQAEVC